MHRFSSTCTPTTGQLHVAEKSFTLTCLPFKAMLLQRTGMQSRVRYGADVTLLSTVATSRKPLWLDLQPVDIKSRRSHNWKSVQVVNSHLVCDPTIRQPGFDLPRQQWSLLNRFRTEQGHCGACRRKWRLTDTDMCPCGETQTGANDVPHCPIQAILSQFNFINDNCNPKAGLKNKIEKHTTQSTKAY